MGDTSERFRRQSQAPLGRPSATPKATLSARGEGKLQLSERCCSGSTGVASLRSSKCTCGVVTPPVMPDSATDLAAPHLLAALDLQLAVVGIGRDPAVGVADQHEIAVALQLVAGIDDGAVLGRLHRAPFGHGKVDAVVALAVRLLAEAGDDAAAHRPAEAVAVAAACGAAAASAPAVGATAAVCAGAAGAARRGGRSRRPWRLPAWRRQASAPEWLSDRRRRAARSPAAPVLWRPE